MARQDRAQAPETTPEPTEVDGQQSLIEEPSSSGGNSTDVTPAPEVEPDAAAQDDADNDGRAYDERGNVRPADARMGEVWEIVSDRDVIVERPGGVRVRITSDGERVQHVLDVEGEYVADTGDSVTAG